MQNVNIGLNWWLAHGNLTPEVVLVRATTEGGGLCRRVIGPEVWVSLVDMQREGEWYGPVVPPSTLTTTTLFLDLLDNAGGELPPPPVEIFVPVYASEPPPAVETADELVVAPTVENESGPACPPEVEALLGKEKDTVVAAQFGLSVNTVAEWRKERGITRFRTKNTSDDMAEVVVAPTKPVKVKVKEVEPPTATDESALSDLVARRFSEGASDEDMAQEAGVPVAKVVDARLALGLRRPRGRKPGVPQGPRKTPSEEEVVNTPTATDAELDALLGEGA
jgi:DNA uptake protein ComE-like DNA-binding protein